MDEAETSEAVGQLHYVRLDPCERIYDRLAGKPLQGKVITAAEEQALGEALRMIEPVLAPVQEVPRTRSGRRGLRDDREPVDTRNA